MPKPSCGVYSHAPECLCDVVIESPVPVREGLTLDDYEAGRDVVAWLGVNTSEGISDTDLLDVFDHLARRRDALVALDDPNGDALRVGVVRVKSAGAVNLSKTTHGAAMFVSKMAPTSVSNGELRAETNRIFGTRITASHMTHMRKRYAGSTL